MREYRKRRYNVIPKPPNVVIPKQERIAKAREILAGGSVGDKATVPSPLVPPLVQQAIIEASDKPVIPKQTKLVELRELMANPQNYVAGPDVVKPRAPLYRRGFHKTGDLVRMPRSNIETVVPEMDELGNELY
ncbi:hypothetical protein LCGC14_0827090 [marine sediment metagenome]|uniref:Uncharacterized protein n=1 Tax=marine sediment metagenome TaxID=412755 RepID=A0A0F9PH15_9ZZZZ